MEVFFGIQPPILFMTESTLGEMIKLFLPSTSVVNKEFYCNQYHGIPIYTSKHPRLAAAIYNLQDIGEKISATEACKLADLADKYLD